MSNFIITGFSGTGSSAVIDFLLEFQNTEMAIKKDYEHYVFNYPNTLFDLESKLLKDNDPLRSDEAIDTFYKTMNFLYDNNFGWFGSYKKYLGSNFMDNVNEFINKIAKPLNGTWYWRFRGVKKSKVKYLLHTMSEIFLNRNHIQKGLINIIDQSQIYYSIPTEDEFIDAARCYVEKFMRLCQVKDKDMIYDHLLWPSNHEKLEKYFSNSKMIIVYRDPRDIFFINKYYWSKSEASCCYPLDVIEFCEYWKRSVKKYSSISGNVLCVNFEDLVYDYENETSKIIDFLNLNIKNWSKKIYYDPNKSISNTQFYKSLKKSEAIEKELKIIEENLRDYLYNFPERNNIDYSKKFL